jgi:hypothetical protein
MMKEYNYLAILVSAIASFVVGFLWFTILFREAYIKGLGKTQEELAKGPATALSFTIQIAGFLLLAFVMAWLINKLQYETVTQGLQLGVIMWLGFVVAIIGPMYAFQAYSLKFFLVISFGYLVSILLTATILSLWKK